MHRRELEPLEACRPRARPRPPSACSRAPLRAARLLLCLILLPALLLIVPLYLRYRVYNGQMYPMSMSDMRLIDARISPTWCQRQVISSNSTFNAYVVRGAPTLAAGTTRDSMTRELELDDDMKEYWGFYLLEGSRVTVSPCVSYPGASLIMIKGYKHLQSCAYVGDDSSEEVDELLEAYSLGLLSNVTLLEKLQAKNKENANDPETMKRYKPGVSFLDPGHSSPDTAALPDHLSPEEDHDPKELRAILEHLHAVRQAAKDEAARRFRPPARLVPVPEFHRHRDTNVDREERQWISFRELMNDTTAEASNSTGNYSNTTPLDPSTDEATEASRTVTETDVTGDNVKENLTETTEAYLDDSRKVLKAPVGDIERKPQVPGDENSKEVFDDVLRRLRALGDRGKRVLQRLHETLGVDKDAQTSRWAAPSEADLDRAREVLAEAVYEESTRAQREARRRESADQARSRRQAMMTALNDDDKDGDIAAEELEPDGEADHHARLNQSTPLDMSNSEFWSSFSSSEEALLQCEGLVLQLPLAPRADCRTDPRAASRPNALSYRVPANGYYFFIFNSENEVQRNYINVNFDLERTRYEVSAAARACLGRARCEMTLDAFSDQRVILELPQSASGDDAQHSALSECEPRAAAYLACAVSVPLLVVIAAFH